MIRMMAIVGIVERNSHLRIMVRWEQKEHGKLIIATLSHEGALTTLEISFLHA
jgi:hypothetical protein